MSDPNFEHEERPQDRGENDGGFLKVAKLLGKTLLVLVGLLVIAVGLVLGACFLIR